MKTSAATALKEEENTKEKYYEDIALHSMLEENKVKRKQDKKKEAEATTASKEEAKRISNAPTADAPEEEVRGENDKNQEKEGTRDNLTQSNINDHLRNLNSVAGARDNHTDKIE